MIGIEVSIDGHHACIAGIGENGVLSAIVNWLGGPDRESDIFLSVGGLDSTSDEHLRWKVPSISVGSTVLVRVLELEAVDPPDERVRHEKQTRLEEYRQHLHECGRSLNHDERQQLLRELVAQLQAVDAEPNVAAD